MAALAGSGGGLPIAIFAYVPEMPDRRRLWRAFCRLGTDRCSPPRRNGAAFGLLPIGWIVLAAIFLYNLTVETGQFEIVKHSVASLSDDRRIQALLIAFSFGAFVEGAAGFGTPVAISAALMIGAGFRPLYAAGLALLANTVAGRLRCAGHADHDAGRQSPGSTSMQLSAMAGRQLPFFSLIVPVWLVWMMAGWRGVLGVWPALLVCGGSFAAVQFLVANFHRPGWSMSPAGWFRWSAWRCSCDSGSRKQIWHFADEHADAVDRHSDDADAYSPRQDRLRLGSVGAADGVRVPVGHCRDVKTALRHGQRRSQGHRRCRRCTERSSPGTGLRCRRAMTGAAKKRRFTTSTGCRPPAPASSSPRVLSAFWLRIGPRAICRASSLRRCYRMRWPLFTIACMLAIAFTTRYSGMDATLGLAFTQHRLALSVLRRPAGLARRGPDRLGHVVQRPVRQPADDHRRRNWSATASCRWPTDQAMILLATANSTGGVMGKMIDAQSIVVAAAATRPARPGRADPPLRLLAQPGAGDVDGVLVLFQAYVWTGVIP